MRVALRVAYKGTDFFGSQIQKETPHTVFGTMQRVFLQLGIQSKIVASGRTDKGVHASGQVCHVDLPSHWSDTQKLKTVANRMLPQSIHIKAIYRVPKEFHARYGAKKRLYRYFIKTGESNPFEADFITFVKECNFEQLQENITIFQGEHDFKNFIKTGSDEKSTTRVIYKSFAYRYNGMIVLYFEANGFLRTQIRLMVGALLELKSSEIKECLYLQKKYKIKPAPPNGLYLAKIKY